jgi:hypothetical protein
MTDDQITALYRAIDPFSYTAANPAVVRTSDPEPIPRLVRDRGAKDAIARIFADKAAKTVSASFLLSRCLSRSHC